MTEPHLSIPTIDIAGFLTGDDAAKRDVVRQIGEAAERYGFFKLVGHGIPAELIDHTKDKAAAFFDLPEAAKMRFAEQRTNRGFQPSYDNVAEGQKPSSQEAFSMGHPKRPSDPDLLALPFYAETPWPDMPGFRDALERCYWHLFGLGEAVLRALALHLGKDESFFQDVSIDTYSNMRVAHYEPVERTQHITDVGIRPHTDQGLITILVQDMVGGLEVRAPGTEEVWLPVVPEPGAIVVNCAQLLTQWTNGRCRSAMHRVFNRSASDRYSIPLFMHPGFTQRIDPADFAAPGEDLRYESFVAGERVYANFARQRKRWREPAQPA